MDRIEAVTVSVDYADVLAQTAPHNRRVFDRWVVVTRPRDEETRMVCARHSIECVLTDDFDRDGKFNKARGINAGLQQLTGDGWLWHLDADIVVPLDAVPCLEDADLRAGNIYGCHRLCVPGWDRWQALQRQGLYSRQKGWLAEYRNRPEGCYVGGVPAGIGRGYTPIGFTQIWRGEETLRFGLTRKWYPPVHGGAARSDVAFGLLWPRVNRVHIPELMVFHLESEDAKHGMGRNWNGRKTPKFGPPAAGEKPAGDESPDAGDYAT